MLVTLAIHQPSMALLHYMWL